jgi:ectoine hydroxylase-related dioxygenase (phytanoyl-CoA dioxygenase family)
VRLDGAISTRDAETLRDIADRKWSDPRIDHSAGDDQIRGVGLMRMFEYHQTYRDLIARQPLIDLVEELVGDECHVIAQTALRTPRANGIVNWHIDDQLFHPWLVELGSPSTELLLPCNVVNVMIALTEMEVLEHGPTQLVPHSHRSGLAAPPSNDPASAGYEIVSVLAKPGDAYLFNNQLWHRGAQNNSDRIRFVVTTAYARRFVAQRFYPFLGYRMPAHVTKDAGERLLRLLGKHPKGPYG